jgi:hypothetical protein
MRGNKEFDSMMNGDFGRFNVYQLWAILNNMDELGINTLKVQKTSDGFICKVDELTVRANKKGRFE